MKNVLKGIFAASVILFAFSGLFFTAGAVTGFAYYGSSIEGRTELSREWDRAMQHFSDHFEHFAITRSGVVFSQNNKNAVKYRDSSLWQFYPSDVKRLIIDVRNAELLFEETSSDTINVRIDGNINYSVRQGDSSISIKPADPSIVNIGPRSQIFIGIPKGTSFTSIRLTADNSVINADVLLSKNFTFNANASRLNIGTAIVADDQMTVNADLCMIYANCISTGKLDIYTDKAILYAGVTDAIQSLTFENYFSDVHLLLPDNAATKAMTLSQKGNYSNVNVKYE